MDTVHRADNWLGPSCEKLFNTSSYNVHQLFSGQLESFTAKGYNLPKSNCVEREFSRKLRYPFLHRLPVKLVA
jgi:hypothetical protein